MKTYLVDVKKADGLRTYHVTADTAEDARKQGLNYAKEDSPGHDAEWSLAREAVFNNLKRAWVVKSSRG